MPLYKKGEHQCVKNYRPVFLLPEFSKIFERLIYNAMFKHFLDNNLISSNQSGFKPGDSCINHFIAIIHDIFRGFGDGLEIRGVFLDISKAFDKLWHEGLIYRLRRNVSILIHLNKRKKLFLHVRSKRLYIHQFSLIISQFNKFNHENT